MAFSPFQPIRAKVKCENNSKSLVFYFEYIISIAHRSHHHIAWQLWPSPAPSHQRHFKHNMQHAWSEGHILSVLSQHFRNTPASRALCLTNGKINERNTLSRRICLRWHFSEEVVWFIRPINTNSLRWIENGAWMIIMRWECVWRCVVSIIIRENNGVNGKWWRRRRRLHLFIFIRWAFSSAFCHRKWK